MAYTTINKSTDYFNTNLHTGTGSTQQITTGLNMSANGGMVWNKIRSGSNNHIMWDTIRTATKSIYPDLNAAEATEATSLTAFTTTGWTAGGAGNTNANGSTYVSWNWLAGSSHSGSANTDGDVNSTVSANTTAGFSAVKFTANGSNNDGIGHGLGVAPKIIFYKRLDSTGDWFVVYKFVDDTLDFLKLNTTDAKTDISLGTYGFSTSTTFSNLGFGNGQQYYAYCFAEKKGYSKFGSYKGNGNNNGTFICTGFKPAWVMIKKTTGDGWQIFDNKRDPYNVAYHRIEADSNAGDYTGLSAGWIDMVSNGFKVRYSGGGVGSDNVSYIYMAFAEEPLVANVGSSIPATAR